nr:MetaGeneMark_Unknown Function [uncultured bacterium]
MIRYRMGAQPLEESGFDKEVAAGTPEEFDADPRIEKDRDPNEFIV